MAEQKAEQAIERSGAGEGSNSMPAPARRPSMRGYGVPSTSEGLLPWSHVQERLERARTYWLCTVRPDGRPHAAPVWGVWVDGRLYFGTGGVKQRNLAANPSVAIHLESGDDVVILEGMAAPVAGPDAAGFARVADAYAAKYDGYRPESAEGQYAVRPRVALAWSRFPEDATRWDFGDER